MINVESHTPQVPSGWRPISRIEIDQFVRSLSRAFEVVGVREERGRLTLGPVDDPSELQLEFPPHVHSPKKYLFPNWEKLFRFRLDGQVLLEEERAALPRVIFGMHPCDLHAVRILDDCLFDGEADSAYRAKREATVLIGVDCVPDEHCFCSSMGTDRVADGFDLFFHRLDNRYLVQVGSEKGKHLLARHAGSVASRDAEPPLPLQAKHRDKRLKFPVESLAPVLEQAYEDKVWQEIGERCLGCGACTLLCPSCYCFNLQDRMDLSLNSGERVRTWDSCQFDQFTRVAGRDDFRSNQADRQRHRFFRKYKYLWDQYKRTACVGCGRCSRECLANIRPVEVLNRLHREQSHDEPAVARQSSEYRPLLAEILKVEELTVNDKLMRLRLPESFVFRPGAFLQLSVFGLGEAPFTIASLPEHGEEVEVMVRSTGVLTRALHRLKAGELVGVRGPYGNGFPIDEFNGKDLLLVAGGLGLVTLRSLLKTVAGQRNRFGRVVLLYGARTPQELLFARELQQWQRQGWIDIRLAVMEPDDAWGGVVGDITYLCRDLDLQPARSVAALSGPAEMYRTVHPLLFRLGFAEERVYLNLERHIKCGLGKCGKCRINDLAVCECGPIFPYSKVRHLREAIER